MKRSKDSVTSMNVLVVPINGGTSDKKQMSEKSSQDTWFTCQTNKQGKQNPYVLEKTHTEVYLDLFAKIRMSKCARDRLKTASLISLCRHGQKTNMPVVAGITSKLRVFLNLLKILKTTYTDNEGQIFESISD